MKDARRKSLILATIRDGVKDLLYYDRKEDEDLPTGAIDDEESEGRVTIEEMVDVFRDALMEGLDEEWWENGP